MAHHFIFRHYEFDTNWLGGGLCIAAAIAINCGVTLQKQAHNKIEALPKDQRPSFWCNRKWMLGTTLQGLGALIDVAALTYASQVAAHTPSRPAQHCLCGLPVAPAGHYVVGCRFWWQ